MSTPQRRRTDGSLEFRVSNPQSGVKETEFQPERIDSILPRTEGGKLAEMRQYIDDANRAAMDYETAAKAFREHATREAELEAQRPMIRQAVVSRIMEDGKVAATNADKQAACDTDYLSHLAQLRETVERKNAAHSYMVSAQMRQQIALMNVRVLMGADARGIF